MATVEKVPGGYRYGKTGKVYKRRIDAVKAGEKAKAQKSSTGHSKGGMTKKKTTGMSTGGSTSRVNEAGNYTQPKKREAMFKRIKAGDKGGKPGQWSARKAQMLAKQYKAAGGGYKS